MRYNKSIVYTKYNYLDYKFPITVFIKITSKCMFKCVFCSQGDACSEEMKLNDVKQLLRKLKKFGVLRIFYTGGEPFLHNEFLDIVKYANKLGFCQLVITNGFLLETSVAREVLDYIDCVSISVHGSENYHNRIVGNSHSYEKVISGIEMIKKNYQKILLDVCFTATSANTNEYNIKSVANLCKKNKIPLTITRTYMIGREKNKPINFAYIKELFKIVDKLINDGYEIEVGHCLVPCAAEHKYNYLASRCTAGIDFCAIDINGDVKICANSSQIIGNIKHTSLKKIWKRNNKILNKHINNLSIYCKNCSLFMVCLGGCKCEYGKIVDGSADLLYEKKIEEKWKKIKDKYVVPYIAMIKKINYNSYLLISKNNCIVDKKTYIVIKNIDFSKTLLENQKMLNVKKELFVCLYDDEFIKVVKDEKIYIK